MPNLRETSSSLLLKLLLLVALCHRLDGHRSLGLQEVSTVNQQTALAPADSGYGQSEDCALILHRTYVNNVAQDNRSPLFGGFLDAIKTT